MEPWAPMDGRIIEDFAEGQGEKRGGYLAGRKGRFGKASFLFLPILISPSQVYVCVSPSFCVSFALSSGVSISLFYYLLGLGQSFLTACVQGI